MVFIVELYYCATFITYDVYGERGKAEARRDSLVQKYQDKGWLPPTVAVTYDQVVTCLEAEDHAPDFRVQIILRSKDLK